MKTRFKNKGETIYDFNDQFLVVCPRCKKCAVVAKGDKESVVSTRVRLVCKSCGYIRAKRFHGWGYSDVTDWWFRQPLWLQTPCCGNVLWAHNLAHLDFLERYVAADIREEGFHHNNALANRLPRWMKLAKHREEVLKGIARLKKRACEG